MAREQQDREAKGAGEFGFFDGRVVAAWHDDGRSMTLVEPFGFIDAAGIRWQAAAGSVVNGASIPRGLWSVIGGPFAGRFRNASVVHDVACEERLRPSRQVHRMFYDACRAGGVATAKAKAMYFAVARWGPRWHVERRFRGPPAAGESAPIVIDDTPPPPSDEELAAAFARIEAIDPPVDEIPALAETAAGP